MEAVEAPRSKRVSIDGMRPTGRPVAVYFDGVDVTVICYDAQEGEATGLDRARVARDDVSVGRVGLRLVDEAGQFTGVSLELMGEVRVVENPTYSELTTPKTCLVAWDRVLALFDDSSQKRKMIARTTTLASVNQHYAISDALKVETRRTLRVV